MECYDQTVFQNITAGNNYVITWETPPDNGAPPAGVREPRKPLPGLPGMPASAEPAYTGG